MCDYPFRPASLRVVKSTGIQIPQTWVDCLELFKETCSQVFSEGGSDSPLTPAILFVCGGKDVGKSTLGRWAVNTLLSEYESVAYLDCDIGQSEFNVSGMVALHILQDPVFGPPFMHIRKPHTSHFVGASSPKDDAMHYLSCIFQIFDTYMQRCMSGSPLPLIVNTQGWVKGLGVPILMELIRYIRPSVLVQMVCCISVLGDLGVCLHAWRFFGKSWDVATLYRIPLRY